MNVVFTKESEDKLAETYTVLPLPPITQTEGEKTVTVEPHVIIDMDKVPLQEISSLEEWCGLHREVVKNHIKQDYSFCEQAISHLMGKFKGELDSYYKHILTEAGNSSDDVY